MGFFVLAGCRGAAPDPATEGTLCVLAYSFTSKCREVKQEQQGYPSSYATWALQWDFVPLTPRGFRRSFWAVGKEKYQPAHCRPGQGSWNKSAGCFFPQVLCRESPCTTHGKSSLVVGVHGVLFPMHPCHVANGQTPLRGVRQWGGF